LLQKPKPHNETRIIFINQINEFYKLKLCSKSKNKKTLNH